MMYASEKGDLRPRKIEKRSDKMKAYLRKECNLKILPFGNKKHIRCETPIHLCPKKSRKRTKVGVFTNGCIKFVPDDHRYTNSKFTKMKMTMELI